jgi:NAD(P)-dependent dehydrogenase (short-subunit alcohol dehydrogenase family)
MDKLFPMKYALVTGTSSGLGYEILQFLLESGYFVFGGSRGSADLEHENFWDLDLDVRSEDSVISFYNEIRQETEQLHLIVNNAGIFEMASIAETSSEEFEDHLMTNALGPFHILKHAYPLTVPGETHVITISSVAGKRGFPNVAAYCASKFALQGLIESCREEWKKDDIRFTNLVPGAIDTPLWNGINDGFDRDRMLDPEDFIHVFEMVVNSPLNMQFPELTFLHRSGVVE